jgi:hypothetical protein
MRNYSALAEASPDEWQAVVSVNLVGVANYLPGGAPRATQKSAREHCECLVVLRCSRAQRHGPL